MQVETEERVFWLRYTDLVIALGAVVRTLPIPGLAEHALGFKSLSEAIHLRNHVLQRLEVAAAARAEAHRRRELTFVFVGAGYAGVEALAELSDLIRDALRFYPSLQAEPQHWVLVDAAPKILPEIPSRLGDYAADAPRAARRGHPRQHDARRGRAACRSTLRRRAPAHEHGRLDRGSEGEPDARRVRTAAGRARPGSRGRDAASRGRAAPLGARGLRRRPEPGHARPQSTRRRRSTRSARRSGSPRTSRARAGPTGTGRSAKSRRSAATAGSPTSSASRSRASSAGG